MAARFGKGNRVFVKVDKVAQHFPVRPLTGHTGTVLEVTKGALVDRVRVYLDVERHESLFHDDELEILP